MANLWRAYIANSLRVFYGDDYGSALHAKLLSEEIRFDCLRMHEMR
jgi:hypothetical protein